MKKRFIYSLVLFLFTAVLSLQHLNAQQVVLSSPQSMAQFTLPAVIPLSAAVSGITYQEPAYLLVQNTLDGYRKLKWGYSPASIYSPQQDVIAGGNTHLEITMKLVSGMVDWSKVLVKPMGTGSLSLQSYISAAGGLASLWKTIIIPLSDFSSAINFTQVSHIQFPYSANAAPFEIAVSGIKFTGGTSPFTWFGEGKTDNLHDGTGGTGRLVANLHPAVTPSVFPLKMEFYANDLLLGECVSPPYQFSWDNPAPGSYLVTSRLRMSDGQFYEALPVTIGVMENPEPEPPSTMSVSIVSPEPGMPFVAPMNKPVDISITGAVAPGPDYMKVTNTLTGYVKLKLGYSPTSLTSPKQNVISGGNDTLEIVMRNMGGAVDWSKIRVRPAATGLVNLGSYAASAGGIGAGWTTIKIPLSAFDPAIDFTALGFMEFPYSANASAFQVGILSIRFIGGANPFTWFGNGKYNNFHDGNGSAGKLTAVIVSPSLSAVDAAKVQLFDNGVMVNEDQQSPFSLTLVNPPVGLHQLHVRMMDTRGGFTCSDTVQISVVPEVPEGYMLVTADFDQLPANIAVSKAVLRYDKDFAYSFSLDDGHADAYTIAFRLFGGGYSPPLQITFPGLYYTDGCGNSIPFKGSLMWNSVNSSFADIHIYGNTYATWGQLNEMTGAGWGVVNHAYSHATGPGTNHAYQINANDSAVFSHTGIHMNHFVAPSGDASYYPTVWDQGIVCAYSRTSTQGVPYGLKVDAPLNYDQFIVFRSFKSDTEYTPENVTESLDNCASLSQNGNHYWYNDFTHGVPPSPVGGSLVFSTFQTYMAHAASTYGANGSDRMWMASGVEVFEYLKLRDACPLSWALRGNQLQLLVNLNNMPSGLLRNAMSLVIDAGAGITSVGVDEGVAMTFRGNTPRKLINLEWQGPAMQRLHPSGGSGESMGGLTEHRVLPQGISFSGLPPSMVLTLPGNTATGEIIVYDTQGNNVYAARYEGTSENGKFRIALPALAGGLYLVTFRGTDGTCLTGKILYPQCR